MPADSADWNGLVLQARQGDQAAARILVERLHPVVARIVAPRLDPREQLEDRMQEVFLKMFTKLDQFRGEVPFEHWVSRIAVTTCIDATRRYRIRPEESLETLSPHQYEELLTAPTHAPGEEMDGQTALELVRSLLVALQPVDRILIEMLDIEGKSLAETASLVGMTRLTARVRAFRARQKLKAQLKAFEQPTA